MFSCVCIFDLAEHDQTLVGSSLKIRGIDIKPNLVGDCAYPLGSWFQTPFPEGARNPEEMPNAHTIPPVAAATAQASSLTLRTVESLTSA